MVYYCKVIPMKEIIINHNDQGQRTDRFLMKMFPSLPKGTLYKAIRNKKIKVNRKRCTIDQRLCEGDVVQLFLPPQLLSEKEADWSFLQVPKALTIVYEDAQVLILDKPVGLRAQSDRAQVQDCVVSRLRHYLYAAGTYDPGDEQSFSPAICHRLDRNTRGLLVAAKTADALREMNAAIREHRVHKRYLACVEGVMEPAQGEVVLHHRKEGTQAVLFERPHPGTQPCRLRYRTLRSLASRTLIEVELHSGRFHQIRAMFAYLHHPLVGDVKYGGTRQKGHQALTAYALSFSFPLTSVLAALDGHTVALSIDDVLAAWKAEGLWTED